MIRLICSETDAAQCAHVGGPVTITHKTFDVDIPELERWLREPKVNQWTYTERRFMGIELIDESEQS
jgi:hypothetical protein